MELDLLYAFVTFCTDRELGLEEMRAHSKKMQEQVSIVYGWNLVYQGYFTPTLAYSSRRPHDNTAQGRGEEACRSEAERKGHATC